MSPGRSGGPDPVPPPPRGASDDPAALVMPGLRLDRWSAEEASARAHADLELGVGGFVVFGGEAEAVRELCRGLRRSAGRDLWIAADLERGAGQQFRGLTELPPPAALTHAPDPAAAVERAGRLTGAEALSVGVNWVLAPVLDLDAERRNPIIATRSFGPDPAVVAELGALWIDACQGAGAMACAKHFPGHGRTRTDSHLGLPRVDLSAEELQADLEPFRTAAARVASMMVAHVAYERLGGDLPATLSPAIVDGILREGLGFDGPVATDAMIMGAVGLDDAAAAVEAVRAGCDIVLYPSDAAETVDRLRRAADGDEPTRMRIRGALARSVGALYRFPGVRRPEAATRAADVESAVEAALETVVARGADLSGWDPRAPTRVVPLSDDPEVGPPAGREAPLGEILAAVLGAAGWSATVARPATGAGSEPGDGPETPTGRERNAPPTAPAAQAIVVLAATPRGWKGRAGISGEAAAAVARAVGGCERALVVVLGHVRWLEDLGLPGICGWSTESVMERAAGEWIRRRAGRVR